MDTCCDAYVERDPIQTELHPSHDDTTHITDANDIPSPRRLGRVRDGSEAYHTDVC